MHPFVAVVDWLEVDDVVYGERTLLETNKSSQNSAQKWETFSGETIRQILYFFLLSQSGKNRFVFAWTKWRMITLAKKVRLTKRERNLSVSKPFHKGSIVCTCTRRNDEHAQWRICPIRQMSVKRPASLPETSKIGNKRLSNQVHQLIARFRTTFVWGKLKPLLLPDITQHNEKCAANKPKRLNRNGWNKGMPCVPLVCFNHLGSSAASQTATSSLISYPADETNAHAQNEFCNYCAHGRTCTCRAGGSIPNKNLLNTFSLFKHLLCQSHQRVYDTYNYPTFTPCMDAYGWIIFLFSSFSHNTRSGSQCLKTYNAESLTSIHTKHAFVRFFLLLLLTIVPMASTHVCFFPPKPSCLHFHAFQAALDPRVCIFFPFQSIRRPAQIPTHLNPPHTPPPNTRNECSMKNARSSYSNDVSLFFAPKKRGRLFLHWSSQLSPTNVIKISRHEKKKKKTAAALHKGIPKREFIWKFELSIKNCHFLVPNKTKHSDLFNWLFFHWLPNAHAEGKKRNVGKKLSTVEFAWAWSGCAMLMKFCNRTQKRTHTYVHVGKIEMEKQTHRRKRKKKKRLTQNDWKTSQSVKFAFGASFEKIETARYLSPTRRKTFNFRGNWQNNRRTFKKTLETKW